MKKKKKKKIF